MMLLGGHRAAARMGRLNTTSTTNSQGSSLILSPQLHQQHQHQQQRRAVAVRLAAPRRAASAAATAGAAPAGGAPPGPPAASASAASAPAPASTTGPDSASGEKAGWWTKKPARGTLLDIQSAQELVDLLADAGDRLVVVDVYASWCGACRALFPKLMQMVEQYAGEGPPDPLAPGSAPEDGVIFCKLNFDDNRKLAKTMGVRVLPYFMFFRGAEGRVAAFSCTTSKLARLRDALEFFSAGVCSLEPNPEVREISSGWDIHPSHPLDATRVEHFWDLDEATPAELSVSAPAPPVPGATTAESPPASGAETPKAPAGDAPAA